MRSTPLIHRLGLALALALALAGALAARAATKTFEVNTTNDTSDGVCAPIDCSLRDAIIEANASPGADTITLPAGTYKLVLAGPDENQSATGDLDILESVTINGAGAGQTIIQGDTGWADRILQVVVPGAVVAIKDVTIEAGKSGAARGGGVYNQGTLTLVNSVVRGNTTAADGGGLASDGALTLVDSTVSGNTAGGSGGGIDSQGALTLANSTLSGNTASAGGGLANGGTTTLNGVTVSRNSASGGSGGGLLNPAGKSISLRNSLVAGNSGAAAPDCAGSLTSQGHNLIGKTVGCVLSAASGDLKNKNPRLGPLRDNGGATLTHELLPGSPALDAGDPAIPGSGGASCPTVDQRGIGRPQTGRCDIGAFEGVGISIVDFAFQPFSLVVRAGTIVRWKNLGAATHTTRSEQFVAEPWTSWDLAPGDTFAYRFLNPTSPGTSYAYRCSIHTNMTGTIFVTGEAVSAELLITRLTPDTAPAGSGVLTVSIDGMYIADGATVRWNGVELTPSAISPPDQVQVQVPANLLATPGDVDVTVVNPGNVESNVLTFTIVGTQQAVFVPLVLR